MKNRWWVLDGHKAVPTENIHEWSRMFDEGRKRVVAQTHVGETFVSTVFLGIDHSYGEGPPLLFETMVFDDEDMGSLTRRYATWEQAERGHAEVVALVEART